MPQAVTWMRTCPASGSEIGRSAISKSAPGLEICATFIGTAAGFGATLNVAIVSLFQISELACSLHYALAVRITLAPSARARRAVSKPMPAPPPSTRTVCPSSSGSRWMVGMVAVLIFSRYSRHRVRGLNTMALSLRSGVTFTHEQAESARSKNPGHQDREESNRRCGSLHHFSETVPQTG